MDMRAEFQPRLEEIKARWQTRRAALPDPARDIDWLVWQLEAAWTFLEDDDRIIEAIGKRLRRTV